VNLTCSLRKLLWSPSSRIFGHSFHACSSPLFMLVLQVILSVSPFSPLNVLGFLFSSGESWNFFCYFDRIQYYNGSCDLVFQVQIVMCFLNVGCLQFIFISF
jgi:hypothetical protein